MKAFFLIAIVCVVCILSGGSLIFLLPHYSKRYREIRSWCNYFFTCSVCWGRSQRSWRRPRMWWRLWMRRWGLSPRRLSRLPPPSSWWLPWLWKSRWVPLTPLQWKDLVDLVEPNITLLNPLFCVVLLTFAISVHTPSERPFLQFLHG